jgi:rhodanese-related sulfurtransferase
MRTYVVVPSIVAVMLTCGACGRGPAATDTATLAAIAQAAARQDDRISVEDLAARLVEGRGDFLLVDVRSPGDYSQGRIGEAQNIPMADLVSPESLAKLPTDRPIFLYSNGSENAAKAAVLLRIQGLDARLVAGGYNAWQAQILNPDVAAAPVPGETHEAAKQRAYACHFAGGTPAGSTGEETPFVPPVFDKQEAEELPPPPAGQESC